MIVFIVRSAWSMAVVMEIKRFEDRLWQLAKASGRSFPASSISAGLRTVATFR